MKTTMLMRPIANPRRTTLANVTDAGPEAVEPPNATAPDTEQPRAEERSLPQRTANPRRTVLVDPPAPPAATAAAAADAQGPAA